ncbi:prepilin-type N-terminal cleavage/methylation domain-containing protein [Salirhabdus euzebyi]|uniref:Prepilin-type N-terminal cleavage/methylation domain-containing protein n=1 Tax=Salirhabdus euzebyi TaxID=394506 RepID=A0A841Q7X9_9BACI|nr:prepilin-type N-terminal cleavage/methylation domain-containing protein [Salirhabdus euzebyi]MBB6454530.1 prepilin-type N-terminal cleavage/methylation domain-containing protein [Salirhabdus euzebyi]
MLLPKNSGVFEMKNKEAGLTLIEIMAVIVIIGILAAISIPLVSNIIEKSKEEVCQTNIIILERSYESYLVLKSVEHTEVVFEQFMRSYDGELCENDCAVSYGEGKVHCSTEVDDEEDDGGGSVPYL